MISKNKEWDWEITPKTTWSGTLKELIVYRNLLGRLVRKSFLVNYQQTILGPVWILLQPVLTLVTFVFVFGNLLGISTEGTPPLLFYFCGIILWNFYSETFVDIAFTFIHHEDIFRKVYFPRLVLPISYLCTHFLRTMVQFGLLLLLFVFYWTVKDLPFEVNAWIFFVPFVFIIIGGITLGFSLLFSVITGKYRDLANIVFLLIRLAMFVTPVIYPLSSVREGIRWFVEINPLSPLFEVFRYAFLSEGTFSLNSLLYSVAFMIVVLSLGIYTFNKQGQRLMDVL
jgi:lipopolysaccharide transport system permease protein